MTLRELSQLRYLRREVDLDRERLARLEANMYPSANLGGVYRIVKEETPDEQRLL